MFFLKQIKIPTRDWELKRKKIKEDIIKQIKKQEVQTKKKHEKERIYYLVEYGPCSLSLLLF